jgi:hypothetical protein
VKRSKRVAKLGWDAVDGHGAHDLTPPTLESGNRSLSSGKKEDVAEKTERAP